MALLWPVDRFNGRGKNKLNHVLPLCAVGKKTCPDEQARVLRILDDDKQRVTRYVRSKISELWRKVGSSMSLWARGDFFNTNDLKSALRELCEVERHNALFFLLFYYTDVVFPDCTGYSHQEYTEREFLKAEGIDYDVSIATLPSGMKTAIQHQYTTVFNGDRNRLVDQVCRGDLSTITIKNKPRHLGTRKKDRRRKTQFYGKQPVVTANGDVTFVMVEYDLMDGHYQMWYPKVVQVTPNRYSIIGGSGPESDAEAVAQELRANKGKAEVASKAKSTAVPNRVPPVQVMRTRTFDLPASDDEAKRRYAVACCLKDMVSLVARSPERGSSMVMQLDLDGDSDLNEEPYDEPEGWATDFAGGDDDTLMSGPQLVEGGAVPNVSVFTDTSSASSKMPPARFHALMGVHMDSTIAARNRENIAPEVLDRSRLASVCKHNIDIPVDVGNLLPSSSDPVTKKITAFKDAMALAAETVEISKMRTVRKNSRKKKAAPKKKKGRAVLKKPMRKEGNGRLRGVLGQEIEPLDELNIDTEEGAVSGEDEEVDPGVEQEENVEPPPFDTAAVARSEEKPCLSNPICTVDLAHYWDLEGTRLRYYLGAWLAEEKCKLCRNKVFGSDTKVVHYCNDGFLCDKQTCDGLVCAPCRKVALETRWKVSEVGARVGSRRRTVRNPGRFD